MSDSVMTQRRDDRFEIVLNRPDQRNAIDWDTMQALDAAVRLAERTPGLRVLLLRGRGRGFSSGIDLLAFSSLSDAFGEDWVARMLSITEMFQGVLTRLERCSLPSIALLHGYALGLGLEIALACDFRIAARGTKLGLPESRLGLIPDVGGTTRLVRLLGPSRAKQIIMTGAMIDLEAAERWGLVNELVNRDDIQSRAEELADQLVLGAPRAVSFAKRIIDGLSDLDRGLQLEAWAQSQLIQTEDFQRGVQGMLTREQPEWRGK